MRCYSLKLYRNVRRDDSTQVPIIEHVALLSTGSNPTRPSSSSSNCGGGGGGSSSSGTSFLVGWMDIRLGADY